jgi:NAD(P)-dependent dehydrogenase (short-subunit alcohol dehydrogenase family)
MNTASTAGLRVRVVGDGALSDWIRASLLADDAIVSETPGPIDAMVFAPWNRSAMTPVPFDHLTDADFDRSWQQTMDAAVAACIGARTDFDDRGGSIVLVTFTTAMAGGAQYAHWAAAAEGVHILAKSVSRQWGPEDIAVNALAISPDLVLADAAVAGPVSIATPARPGATFGPALSFLCSPAARDLAGQTLTVDGGSWM